jgi:hypothetical protein
MWRAVLTQADADTLLGAFGYFHDGCIREAHVWGGYHVNPDFGMSCPETPDLRCRLVVQRQRDNPATVELFFDGVSLVSFAAPPNYDRIISAATLRVDAGIITWSPGTEPDEGSGPDWKPSKIVSTRLWWRAIENGLGPKIRYGMLKDLPEGIAL